MPQRNLTRQQLNILLHSTPDKQAALTAFVLQWEFDGKLPDITAPAIIKLAAAANIEVSRTTIHRWLQRSPAITKFNDKYELADEETFIMRLEALERSAHWKETYFDKPALFMFGDSDDVSEDQYVLMEDHRNTYPDKPPDPVPFSAADSPMKVVLPDHLPQGKTLSDWWPYQKIRQRRNRHPNRTIP